MVYQRTVWTYGFWRQDREAQIRGLADLAAALERGDREYRFARPSMFEGRKVKRKSRWGMLEDLCARLERLARVQLGGKPFDPKQSGEILAYGVDLAEVMGYHGSSFLYPVDNAPRITDVYTDTSKFPALRHLQVGVARPRALYVLYPWRRREVLCLGAVMPYYEFTRPERLSDCTWRQLLDTQERPAQPPWIRPLAGSGASMKKCWQKKER